MPTHMGQYLCNNGQYYNNVMTHDNHVTVSDIHVTDPTSQIISKQKIQCDDRE